MTAVIDHTLEPSESLPPSSIDAEMSLIGSLWMTAGDAAIFAQVKGIVSPASFFDSANGILFRVMCEMVDAGKPIDGVLLYEELKRRQLMDELGGSAYLSQVWNIVPSPAHWEQYAKIVREKAMWRAGIEVASRFLAAAHKPAKEDRSVDALNEMMAATQKIVASGTGTTIHRLGDVLLDVVDRKGKKDTGERLPTGLLDLDQFIGGFRKGSKTIIGGKAGMGKSALEKALAINMAERGTSVGIISIEETVEKIGENVLSFKSEIPNNRIAFNTLAKEEWEAVMWAAGRLDKLPIYLVDCVRRLGDIEAAAHMLVAKHQVQVIFVDHLHIIDGGGDENRNAELTRISSALKFLWKKLGVAGVELAQLNRGGGSDKPGKHNLRDSGSLEQDADIILLLHREDYYRENHAEDDQILEIIVAKNKDGAEAIVPVYYDPARYLIRMLLPMDNGTGDEP